MILASLSLFSYKISPYWHLNIFGFIKWLVFLQSIRLCRTFKMRETLSAFLRRYHRCKNCPTAQSIKHRVDRPLWCTLSFEKNSENIFLQHQSVLYNFFWYCAAPILSCSDLVRPGNLTRKFQMIQKFRVFCPIFVNSSLFQTPPTKEYWDTTKLCDLHFNVCNTTNKFQRLLNQRRLSAAF